MPHLKELRRDLQVKGGIKIPKISTFVGGIENTDIGRSVFEEYNFI